MKCAGCDLYAQMLLSGSLTPCNGCELYQAYLPETGEAVRQLHPLAEIAVKVSTWVNGGPIGEARFAQTPIYLNPFQHGIVMQCMDVIAELRTEREKELEEERARDLERGRNKKR